VPLASKLLRSASIWVWHLCPSASTGQVVGTAGWDGFAFKVQATTANEQHCMQACMSQVHIGTRAYHFRLKVGCLLLGNVWLRCARVPHHMSTYFPIVWQHSQRRPRRHSCIVTVAQLFISWAAQAKPSPAARELRQVITSQQPGRPQAQRR
jgi:hypothetical protein